MFAVCVQYKHVQFIAHNFNYCQSLCKIVGKDVTDEFVALAQASIVSTSGRRKKRQSSQNNVINVPDDPIKLNENYTPPVSAPLK